MEKKMVLAVFCLLSLFFTGCGGSTQNQFEKNDSIQSSQINNSESTINDFIGTWHCDPKDSINNMDITLTLTKNDDTSLNFHRKMVDMSGEDAGSDISGMMIIFHDPNDPKNIIAKTSYLKQNGYVSITGNTLCENFDNGTFNTFKKT